jgi:chorismate mutase / prephenate dehydratase
MLDLNVIREQIDGIDKQLVDLFEQRMKLTKEVAEYKIQTGKNALYHIESTITIINVSKHHYNDAGIIL